MCLLVMGCMILVQLEVPVNGSYKQQRAKESNCSQHDEEEVANKSHVAEIEGCLQHATHFGSV
jgi:hypothetical protein